MQMRLWFSSIPECQTLNALPSLFCLPDKDTERGNLRGLGVVQKHSRVVSAAIWRKTKLEYPSYILHYANCIASINSHKMYLIEMKGCLQVTFFNGLPLNFSTEA